MCSLKSVSAVFNKLELLVNDILHSFGQSSKDSFTQLLLELCQMYLFLFFFFIHFTYLVHS